MCLLDSCVGANGAFATCGFWLGAGNRFMLFCTCTPLINYTIAWGGFLEYGKAAAVDCNCTDLAVLREIAKVPVVICLFHTMTL